jgi:hypothetical protein
MAKTNYQVTFNGKVVGIRKSDRIYTHAVVVQDDADAFYHWAHNYVPNETDRKNFAYDSKRAVQIVERHAGSVAQCPLLGAKRKTYARMELFRF